MTGLVLALVMLASKGPERSPPPPPAPVVASVDQLRDLLVEGMQKADEGDLAGALVPLRGAAKHPLFDTLDEPLRLHVWTLLAYLERPVDPAASMKAARRATSLYGAGGLEWGLRFDAARAVGDATESAIALTQIARRWPAVLDVSIPAVTTIVRRLGDQGDPDRLRRPMLTALLDAGWAPMEAPGVPDWYRQVLVQIMLEDGDVAEARRIAQVITQPDIIVAMRSDRQFDRATAGSPEPDWAAVWERHIELRRRIASDTPRSLHNQNEVVLALRRVGRYAEALDLLDDVLVRARAPGDFPFDDRDQLNWAMDYRADALGALGRHGEALEQQAQAARRPENGRINVSNAINLGAVLYVAGRPQEALDALRDIEDRDLSPYGALAADQVRVCALDQLGERARAEQIAEGMAAKAQDGVTPLTEAMLCLDDRDAVAKIWIEALESPQRRNGQLAIMQTYVEPPNRPPYEIELDRRRAAILARPDVQAAVAKVGRLRSYPFTAPPS